LVRDSWDSLQKTDVGMTEIHFLFDLTLFVALVVIDASKRISPHDYFLLKDVGFFFFLIIEFSNILLVECDGSAEEFQTLPCFEQS
jgi:hypothetical protein